MKVLSSLMVVIIMALSFSMDNVLVDGSRFEELQKKYPNAVEKLEESTTEPEDFSEMQKKYPNAVHGLIEGDEKDTEGLKQKVEEDMKKHPELVQFAVPVDDADEPG
ncbi:hypothetical protein M1I95_01290 [Rossellomorea marisflavi]|uniref:hypothetical protein n=1 Tax=Rossellomorea marisflavi TaxID=189381 RepID=UPI00279918B4|nr:hypothetical protein [Rossellomorea marisflavi]UTE73212.1 hypothetical protein M1I95_01290 [Rossellomorea marisflavi]